MKIALSLVLLGLLAHCGGKSIDHSTSPSKAITPIPSEQSCDLLFIQGMRLSEIAQISYRMNQECGLSEDQVILLLR